MGVRRFADFVAAGTAVLHVHDGDLDAGAVVRFILDPVCLDGAVDALDSLGVGCVLDEGAVFEAELPGGSLDGLVGG